jgi:D-arginine dehydrogenase
MKQHKTRAKCVIVGAGFAGAATAYHLTQMGLEEVVVLEQEAIAGMHASGRNAAMVRQVVADESIAALAREGAAFLQGLPRDWPLETSFKQSGAFLLGKQQALTQLEQAAGRARQAGVPAEWWPLERIKQRLPVLKGSPAAGGIYCPTDGVIDIHNLLHGYLRLATARGAEVKYSSKVQQVIVREGKVCAVQTEAEEIETGLLVNAAGAWAGELARLAGATPIALTAYRRHLFITAPCNWTSSDWPIVWDLSYEVYFRPEAGGLLLSPGDETAHPPASPATDPAVLEMLADKVIHCFPALSDLPIRNGWACLRTMAPDRRFVIGWDPRLAGFFWVAGLGGHGVTVSYSVGRLAAKLILQKTALSTALELAPGRFHSLAQS